MDHGLALIDGKYPLTNRKLGYLSGLGKGIGFLGFKAELSNATASKYPDDTWGADATSLTDLAQKTPMADFLADSGIGFYSFNTFSIAVGTDNPWNNVTWTQAVGDAIEAEFYDLCVHLRDTYDKEITLQSWEGDWQMLNAFDPKKGIPLTHVATYRDWHRRRIRAMRQAIDDTAGSDCTLYYGIEMNRVLDDWGRRVHRDVLRNVAKGVPFARAYLSIYEAIEGWLTITDQATLEADIDTKLNRVIDRVLAELPSIPIVFGEYGFPVDAPYFPSGTIDAAALHAKVIAIGTARGVVAEYPWQCTDNEELSPGVPRGFGFWARDGNNATVGAISDVGAYYRDFVL